MNFQQLYNVLDEVDNEPYPKMEDIKPDYNFGRMVYNSYSGTYGELTAITQYVYENITNKENNNLERVLMRIAMDEMKHFKILGELLVELGFIPYCMGSRNNKWCSNNIKYNFNSIIEMLKYNIETDKIDLEITESATVDSNVDILKVLNRIKAKGFKVSIDDFGTGNSSLSMIQSMPIDVIKIDKIFVDKADLDSEKNIINYIMYLAERLEVRTIVEGVETKEQVEFIRKLECDIIQGYYYSKPLSKADFEDYFNKRRD